MRSVEHDSLGQPDPDCATDGSGGLAARDLETVQSWGFDEAEALEVVTRRAVARARRVADQARVDPDPVLLRQTLRYLEELRTICRSLAAARRT